MDLFSATVIEGIEGISLSRYIKDNILNRSEGIESINEFLDIAISITENICRLHQEGLILRNLNPDGILINPDNAKTYIIDFSCAEYLTVPGKNTLYYDNSTNNPEYMSPEQTGWVKMEIDQRSDLYSLGAIFYEIITGNLPLIVNDLVEWTHAHLARKIETPENFNPSIPTIISRIIMRLLEKAPEDRYQSAYGLLEDLKECKRQITLKGAIEPFPIAHKDVSANFHLPKKLYGRYKDRIVLKEAFDYVCDGHAAIVLVSGYPGIGKTMLVNECLKSFVQEKGHFIAGKFDQLKQSIPYAPISAAFANLVKRLMTENQEILEAWKKKILHALGRNGTVITEFIPELEWIIGKQNPIDLLSPKETENRFQMVFRDFVMALSGKEYPLVIFLDDLQWADSSSLHLLRYLSQDANLQYILFIGAYRENEVDENHALTDMLTEFNKGKVFFRHISLLPIEKKQILEMITETLHTGNENITGLVETLYRKTAGNPFFLEV